MECKVLGAERKMQNTKKIEFVYNIIYYLIYIYIINL